VASLQRAVASLSLTGDDLDPSKVTELLGGSPTRAWRKGDDIRMRPDLPERIARRGHWRKEATPTEPENLDAQVLELLSGLTTDLAVWKTLGAQCRMSIFCGWFMSGRNEGVEISPSTLLLLGERGIRLDLDIYAPDDEA
jgi:hypothetical protein